MIPILVVFAIQIGLLLTRAPVPDDFTLIDGVVCHRTSVGESAKDVRRVDNSFLPLSDPMVRADYSLFPPSQEVKP